MANPEHLEILKQGVSVWNKWRKECPETEPDLRGLSLDFIFPFDEEAHLGGGNFEKTNFEDADLDGVSFYDGYEFYRTSLSGANLKGAHLGRAHLHLVDLTRADFTGAVMGFTLIGDTDLSETTGLAEVIHRFPTSIDVVTIERTFRYLKPGIVQSGTRTFLANAGIPEHLLEHYLKFDLDRLYSSCFISYNHSERSFADHLRDQLQRRGIRCWLDAHDLEVGERILDAVNKAIRRHDKLLLCCSMASLTSSWVEDEIAAAIELERKQERLILIPLDLDGYLFDGYDGRFGPRIRERLVANFTGWQTDNTKFKEQFRRVLSALRTDEGAREKVPESKP